MAATCNNDRFVFRGLTWELATPLDRLPPGVAPLFTGKLHMDWFVDCGFEADGDCADYGAPAHRGCEVTTYMDAQAEFVSQRAGGADAGAMRVLTAECGQCQRIGLTSDPNTEHRGTTNGSRGPAMAHNCAPGESVTWIATATMESQTFYQDLVPYSWVAAGTESVTYDAPPVIACSGVPGAFCLGPVGGMRGTWRKPRAR